MTFNLVLLIVLVMMVAAAAPTWPYSRGWGYVPSGVMSAIVVLLLIVLFMGRAWA
ncbi:MAG: DUF3309 domain-containing protein [Burkholderiaceae bacterium]